MPARASVFMLTPIFHDVRIHMRMQAATLGGGGHRAPRRAGCNVAVERATITEKPNYKPTNCTPVVQMASNAQETTPAPVEVPAANNAPAEPEQPLDPEKARLMQEVLSSVEEQDRMAKELKEAQDKLQGF